MAYINIFVSNDASVTVKNNQLVLLNKDNSDSFPLEDINSVMVESLRTSISTYTLYKLAENGVVCFFCDEKHIPNSYFMSFNNHFNQLKIYKLQNGISTPFQKQLWKNIVIHKIQNQNICLQLCGKNEILKDLPKNVKSDDSSNMEAVAASKYFKELFSKEFSRNQDNDINSALNYGYTILRGVIVRNIVVHGLVPFLGLKHCSELNNFNLADDLMEVFRPFVDLYVYNNCDVSFGTEYKLCLYGLLNKNCVINNAKYTLSYAMEMYVQSFVDSLESGMDKLKFPTLCEIEDHEFM